MLKFLCQDSWQAFKHDLKGYKSRDIYFSLQHSLCRLLVAVQQFTWFVWRPCLLLHNHCKWPPTHGAPTILASTSSRPCHHQRQISLSQVASTLQPNHQRSVIPFPSIHTFTACFSELDLWTTTTLTTWQPRGLLGRCTAITRHVVSMVTGISKTLSCALVQE